MTISAADEWPPRKVQSFIRHLLADVIGDHGAQVTQRQLRDVLRDQRKREQRRANKREARQRRAERRGEPREPTYAPPEWVVRSEEEAAREDTDAASQCRRELARVRLAQQRESLADAQGACPIPRQSD